LSAVSLLARGPSLNRTLTAISLRPQSQDDSVLSYKGRGKGRRRRVGQLKRSGSLGSMLFDGDDNGRGPVGVALTQQQSKLAGNYIKRPKIHKVSVPYFTVIVTLLDVILMIWEFIEGRGFAPPKVNPMLGPNGIVLLSMGGKWVPAILKGGEWWRFITSIFLHGGLVHIGLNLLTQTKMLWDLEKVHGTFRIVPIYLLSGIGGMVLSAVFLPNQVTVGASGAIFGFHAVLLVDLLKNWTHVKSPKMKLLMVLISIVIAFAMGLLPGIDNFAHAGGFVVGLLSAFIFLPSMHIGGWSVTMRLLQVCVALPLLIAYFVGFLVPFYRTWNGNSFCSWCHFIACLPFWKTCNGGS
jgi:membrane associated rhomboid family serine protease